MRDEECIQCFCRENLKEKDPSEELGVDGILLEWILEKLMRRCGLDSCLGTGISDGLL